MPARPTPSSTPPPQTPGVIFQPKASAALKRGIDVIVDAIRPTLGPLPRLVAIERILPGKPPETLDSGATIARRILQIQPRDADMGAMFVRHMLWKLQEKQGDGTAAAAVIFQSLYHHGLTYIAAGGNAAMLRRYLEEGLRLVDEQLTKMTVPLHGKDTLARYAETVCHDAALAEALGEIHDILGPYGRLEIRNAQRTENRREYVQGIHWEEGPLSPEMILNKREWRTTLPEAWVVVTDLEIDDPEDVIHLLELALQNDVHSILLVARALSDRALGVLFNPANRRLVQVLAVKTPGSFVDAQYPALTDLAVLTGGRPLLSLTSDRLQDLTVEDCGMARRIWATRDTFGITTGKGDPCTVQEHVKQLQAAYRNCDKANERDLLALRIGRLLGGSATLWLGAQSDADYEEKKQRAERASRALRAALLEGVVPGGGTALLACRPPLLEQMRQSEHSDRRAAYRILAMALEEPFRTLISNARGQKWVVESGEWGVGDVSPGEIVELLAQNDFRCAFDLRQNQIVDPFEAGLLDAAAVLRDSIHSAVSSAALLLTTDVLVHRKNPPMEYNT